MKKVATLLSYGLAILLGVYLTKEFKYNEPIEAYRWITTLLLFGWFLMLSKKEDEE